MKLLSLFFSLLISWNLYAFSPAIQGAINTGGVLTLDDTYSESNYPGSHTGAAWLNATYATEAGVSFTSGGGELDSVKFYLAKGNSPTGTLSVNIYAHTGTYGTSSVPTGSALATSGTMNAADLTTTATLYTFNFTGTNRIMLSAGYYVIALVYSGSSTDTNVVYLEQDNSSPSHDGNSCDNYEGWTAYNTTDAIFYVYVYR